MKFIAMMVLLFTGLWSHAQTHELKGTTTGINIKNMDGLVDFALIIPGMSQQEVINFNLGKVISPANDTLKVFTYTLDLPSNLSLPDQTEKYFISINLNKPEFRAYVDGDGVYNIYGVYGKFPLNEMVKGFQNDKSLFELIAYFNFLSGGIMTIPVKGNVSGIELPINQFSFTEQYSVKAPSYDKSKTVVAFSLFKENDQFYPADMKNVASNKSQNLMTKAGAEHWNLSLMMNSPQRSFRETFDGNLLSGMFGSYSLERATSPLSQLSYHFVKAQATNIAEFLPMIQTPVFDKSLWSVRVNTVAAITGAHPYATALVLSEVTPGGTETFPIDFKKTLWSSQYMGWQQTFQIPVEAQSLIQAGKDYSWDVIYFATTQAEQDSEIVWSKVSHVTRNAVNF